MNIKNNDDLFANDPLRILVVDDDKNNFTLAKAVLAKQGYEVEGAFSGSEALQMIKERSYDVILLDVMMPKMDGFEVCRRIKEDESTRLIPVIIVTALNEREDKIQGIDAGCDDFVTKPFDFSELTARVRALGKVKRLNDDLDRAETAIMSLARAVEAKDDATGQHCDRLIDLAREFADFLKLKNSDAKTLERACVLHDVGKIGVPDSVLLKPDKLTEEEWEIMRKHPLISEDICKPLRSLKEACPIIRAHHEHWNGSGYPDGLKENEIPYLARVFQILDAYEALTTERPYKKALSVEETIKTLKEETKQGQWDPKLMDQFMIFITEKK
ncbi:response regulator [bacterium]|nr:response regulator [bacterium]